jgi:hypothetical protein
LEISLVNSLTDPVSGRLSVTMSQGKPLVADFTAPGSSSVVVPIPFSQFVAQAGKQYTATIAITTSSGYTYAKRVGIALLAANLVKSHAADAAWTTSNTSSTADTLHVSWDAYALYVSASLTGPNAAMDPFRVAVDLDPNKIERSTGDIYNDLISRRRFSILTITPTANGVQAARTYSFNFDKLHTAGLPSWELPVKMIQNSGSSSYRVTIPWKELSATDPPQAGQVIGLAVERGDASQPGAPLFGNIGPSAESNTLGSLVLSGAP